MKAEGGESSSLDDVGYNRCSASLLPVGNVHGSANGKERSTGVCQRLIPVSLVLFCGSLRKDRTGKRAGSYASLCSTKAGRNSPTPSR